MRLQQGVTLDRADQVLRAAESQWSNARSADDLFRAYTDAVNETYPLLKEAFADPDIGGALRTTAYWNLLALVGARPVVGITNDPAIVQGSARAQRAQNQALRAEIEDQVKALGRGRSELDALKKLAARPGLPIVYDTNMLNHWQQPRGIRWREVLQENGEETTLARLVVPLQVIDELDRQKYGKPNADLAKRAATAIRYLEREFSNGSPGEPVALGDDATLEVWSATDEQRSDADLSILRCAIDLEGLHPDTGARVLTGDLGMRLRGQQRWGLKTLRLPDKYRKPGTAIGDLERED